MSKILGAVFLFSAVATTGFAVESSKPDWAYAIPVPGQPAPPQIHENAKTYGLPGTALRFTRNKVEGRSEDGTRRRVVSADWFPNEHPPMPRIVAEGDTARGIVACALCHSPSGRGRPQ